MVRHFGHVLICMALFAIAGGHWVVLQGVAWGTMIVEFSKTAPLPEAVEKTLSGEAPCPMCLSIAKAKQEESRDKPSAPAQLTLDKVVLSIRFEFPKRFSTPSDYYRTVTIAPSLRSQEPSVPVPIRIS